MSGPFDNYASIPSDELLYGYNYADVLTDADFLNPGERGTLASGQSMPAGKCLASGPCKLFIAGNPYE